MCLNALFTRFVPVDEVAVELLIFAMTLFPSICSASSHGLRIFDIKQDPKLPLHNQSMQHVFCKVFSKLSSKFNVTIVGFAHAKPKWSWNAWL